MLIATVFSAHSVIFLVKFVKVVICQNKNNVKVVKAVIKFFLSIALFLRLKIKLIHRTNEREDKLCDRDDSNNEY